MPLSLTDIVLLTCGLFFVGHLLTRSKYKLPPGPPGLPIIGNLFDFPSEYDWKTYASWADKWGPIVSASAFGTTIIVLDTYPKAMEMMEHKSHIYSSRPYVPMANLMNWNNAMAFTVYGPRFRSYRKIFHNELGNSVSIKTCWPQEETHAREFVRHCLEAPERLQEHCFQHAGAIILRVAYGYIAQDHDDEFVLAGNAAMDCFNRGTAPGAFLVNQMPILRYIPEWVPGAGFQRTARLWRPLYSAMVEKPFNFVKQGLAAGTAEDSFTARWLKKGLSPEEEDCLKHASGSMFGGGGETTAITVYMFFLLMALHPEVQKKAQAEIDTVVGRDRLPSFEDRESLPYLEALTKEVMRLHPVAPSGLPHCTSEDDMHDGYFIPKGSIVMPNIWRMTRNPDVYSNPMMFNPERFLGPSPEQDPREYSFGFGRRVCPGRLLADASLYITIAMCLSACDIAPVEEHGTTVVPEYKPQGGPVSRLDPFSCSIKSRFKPEALVVFMD